MSKHMTVLAKTSDEVTRDEAYAEARAFFEAAYLDEPSHAIVIKIYPEEASDTYGVSLAGTMGDRHFMAHIFAILSASVLHELEDDTTDYVKA